MSLMMEIDNLPASDTGLPLYMWLGEVGGHHGPRIKVSNTPGKSNFVAISKTPEVLTPKSVKVSQHDIDLVFRSIILNHDTLIKIWDVFETGEGKVFPLFSQLKPV